ncbi:MAG: TetR/AcrR family transcriptional regulator [Sporichthyaceae bacterium]
MPEAATSPPQSRADAQRARVVGIAADIFGRRGFRATSMNEIAAAAGLSKPTLYHYFRSKEEILVLLYTEVLDESLLEARSTLAAAPTPLAGIRDLIAARVAYTCRNARLLTVCFEEEHELPAALAEQLLTRRRAVEDLFSEALGEHLRAHPSLLPGVAPKVYVNACLGAANWCYKWYRPDGPATPEELGLQIASAMTAALEI